MTERLSKDEQDSLVGELSEGLGTMDEEEFDASYEKLDADHQLEVDRSIRNYADNAVGDEHWDSDN